MTHLLPSPLRKAPLALRLGEAVGVAGLLLLGLVLAWGAVTVKLDTASQAVLGCTTALIFLVGNRFAGRSMTLFLTVLSGLVSLRYIVWRFTETLDFETLLQGAFGTGLALAEAYAIVVLALGYFQTIWPLERKLMPLPPDPGDWPGVDVYVPTYNESLEIVRATVLAALAMDWPRDKLHVYILDDGRRREFREFAETCGAGYITRPDNAHAKAGNLNHAMTLTGGEFIAVFDCDHIPTRAFLQMTLGWLVRDSRIAFLQTPHHFYSPDPFQRNLKAGRRVPPEGNMFYGLVQDGNDFWDAAFFCGSCAIIRRTALDSIGGFATETVTEDCHTALRLHRQGWQSAYLRLPLAAGLATERLILHIGQRVRWARGMLQIARLDNPLFGRGLRLGQRLCYLNAMMHFFFALPRIVFLTSPLAFLLFNENMIAASPLAIIAYALPHIFHSVATNSRTQGGWRHSFWSEIYETVLALFLVRITIVTMVSPRRGRFNVTEKGGILKSDYFDMTAVYPNIVMCAFLIVGLGRGLYGMLVENTTQLQFQALLMNTIWVTFSLLIVLAAIAVGRETRQVRNRARIRARLPATAWLPDGRTLQGVSHNVSLGGGAIIFDAAENLAAGTALDLEFSLGEHRLLLPARIERWERRFLQVSWRNADIADESRIVQLVFGRADAWVNWGSYPRDRPLASLWSVLVSIEGLFRWRGRPVVRAELEPVPTAVETLPRQSQILQPRSLSRAASVAACCWLAGLSFAEAQPIQPNGPRPSAPSIVPPVPSAVSPGIVQPPDTRTVALSLRDLGASGPMTMRGTSAIQGVLFGIRADEAVTDARLTLNGALSPALLPDLSNVTVTLNEQYVGTIPAGTNRAEFGPLELPINPLFFRDRNRLNFRFSGRYTRECNDALSGLLWATVSDRSTLTMRIVRVPPRRDLARLPLPLFDANLRQKLVLPVVLPNNPSNDILQAAGIVSSWFGKLADFRGADFPVSFELPNEGNAVVVVAGHETLPDPSLPSINGPTIEMIANPNDPLATLLVVGGRSGAEAIAAANALVSGSRLMSGQSATKEASALPVRQPYDAPAWIATDRPVRFGELVDPSVLQGVGYVPGTMHVPFRTAPDLYTWRQRPFRADVRFRAPPGPIMDVAASRLDVSINDLFLRSYPLHTNETVLDWILHNLGFTDAVGSGATEIPTYTVFAENDLQLFFDARPLNRGDCGAIPDDVHMSVDADSTLDLTRAHHFTELPNLTFFANSGFPFTRLADLAETVVVLPPQPSPVEITAFLDLMGNFGAATFQPVNRVTVQRANKLANLSGKDLILMGTLAQLGGAAALLERSPVRIEGNGLRVVLGGALQGFRHLFGGRDGDPREKAAVALTGPLGEGSAALVGAAAPAGNGRSLVALIGGSPQAVKAMVEATRTPALVPGIQGDLVLLSGGSISAYRVGASYTVGELPFWLWPEWWLRDQPLLVVLAMVLATAVIAALLYRLLRWRAGRRVARAGAVQG